MHMGCCRFCSASLRTLMVDLGMSPLANAYRTAAQLHQMEPFYPLRVYVCERCWLVQLEACTAPESMFSDYAYFSSYADSWLQHAKAHVEMAVERFRLTATSHVIEIASNDGLSLSRFLSGMMRLSHHHTVTGGTTHGRCTVHRAAVPSDGVPGFHERDA